MMTINTIDTFAVISNLTPGTKYTVKVIAIAGDDETEGEPYTLTPVTSKNIVVFFYISCFMSMDSFGLLS